MKQIILPLAFLAMSAAASAEVCRSTATVWQEDGYTYRTEISTRADNGCKRIKNSIDGVEQEGVDCNCDLIIDGMEGLYKSPDPYAQTSLLEICHGPEADPALYDNEPWIRVVD